MANLKRSAKSSSSWGINELIAFNIGVNIVKTQTFFGSPNLPQLTVSPVILNNLDDPTKPKMDFFTYLEDAMNFPPEERSFLSYTYGRN